MSESLKAQRTQRTQKEEGNVRIGGLSESLKAQRTQRTQKVEGYCLNQDLPNQRYECLLAFPGIIGLANQEINGMNAIGRMRVWHSA
ncbi:MAG: hypothetical protein OXD54_10080 [Candidatus Poribacteria bacterium]|nr:hypothetical protein [Candidatus Poribacteria bacterium]